MVHDPEGKTIFVDCLCVDPRHQQQKVGSTLLREYIKRFTDGPYDGITLLAHEELIGFYVAAGFKLIGKSEVVEGSRPWFELRYSLRSQIPDVTTQRRILEVVREQNGQLGVYQQRKKLASHFPGGNSELTDERGSNKLPLYCPRVACRSVILTKGAAALVECFSVTVTVYCIIRLTNHQHSDFKPDRRSSEPSTTGSTSSPATPTPADIGMEDRTPGEPHGIQEHRVLQDFTNR